MPMAGNEALSHLLIDHRKIEVIVVSEDSNWLHIFKKEDKPLAGLDDLAVAIASAIAQIQPDVVFLGESMPMVGNEALSHLLTDHRKIRVIVVSEDGNWLHVFKKEDKLLTGLNDLAVAITSA